MCSYPHIHGDGGGREGGEGEERRRRPSVLGRGDGDVRLQWHWRKGDGVWLSTAAGRGGLGWLSSSGRRRVRGRGRGDRADASSTERLTRREEKVPMADQRNGGNQPANGAKGGYKINLEKFRTRLRILYSSWRENSELWGSSDAVAVAAPPPSEDLRYLKSSALQIWLLGYEFPDTIMCFTKKQIHFLCSPKKANLLEEVRRAAREAVGVDVVMHVKPKNDDGTALMDSVFQAIRAQSRADGKDAPIVGQIAKEAPEGNLLETWVEKLKGAGFELVDVTNGLSDLLAVKDADELINVKKAAYLTFSVMNNVVVPKLESVIDDEKKVSHSVLMDEAEKAILDPGKAKAKLKADNVDICYPPIFQSGGEFDLRPSAASNDENLYYDSASVIICAVGSRYNSYCSNVARTYLIDANPLQSKAYSVLLKAHEAAIGALKPGNSASAVYQSALSVVQNEAPELVPNLTKNAGTGIGLEFRESGLILNAKNDRVIKARMVFNVALGFQNLQNEADNPKIRNFSLLLADTVIVGDQQPEVLTSKCSKAIKDVAYSFNEDDEEEDKPKAKSEASGTEALMSKTTLRSDNGEISKEELRRQHQAELARQKNEETARRLAGAGSSAADSRSAARASTDLVAYKNVNDIPQVRDLMIQIDQKNEAVLLPIYGSMVPFHVATVRTVSSQQDTNRNCYIRIIFNVPGTPFNPHDANTLKFQGTIYLKEVSFRSKDPRHISEVVQQIKTLRRQVMARESERAERATLVSQEKLQLAGNRFKPIKLHDLWIRPVFGGRGRKQPGSLEAHVNGFRYATNRADERVDVMFANIKHAFFQPAEKEMITLLHFHLHNHIMVGNKKTKDVQFYVEVMDVVQTLGGAKRSAYDPDEIEEEQRERDRKNKINMDFQSFVNRVNDLWSQPQFSGLDLEFDQPLRELGFHGVPYKATAFIVPTSSCLVELIETPFLVVTLSEIEIVNLERVGLGQKNFDMTIVFKDFKRDVLRIDSIPSTSLDGIKEWLDTTDIKYYESRLNLNWRQILKTITDDPQSFIDDGGWEFLNLEASDSDSDNSEESDQGYEPSDAEPESESEDDESDSASLVESEDEEDESEEDSEEEKGKTWEELEREASNADREKGADSDSEEERNRRKMKAYGKSRAPPSGSMPKRSKFR
ncbi:FACT complex subunit spt16 [Turnera subulata]|uniref:FACT complex subunit n=1 Tax=Turnera subulata TaxID=218843 RepID=A0A9Q0J9N7_9ROSI|nr:FACT complex subunit spt16 [Turnera subulata]